MPEANAEHLLLQSVQLPQEQEELTDPLVVAVRIIATAGDDEAVVDINVLVGRELAAGDAIEVPSLPLFAKKPDEHFKVSAVHFLDVLGVLGTEKDGEPFLLHLN